MTKSFAVYEISTCENYTQEGDFIEDEQITYVEESIAAFLYENDAVSFAKTKGEGFFVINLHNGVVVYSSGIVIKTKKDEENEQP